jgi:ATP-dependent Clp protease ATP-binding subunit ClpB
LRRFIAKEVETRVARALLRAGALEGETIRVDVEGEQLVVAVQTPAGAGAREEAGAQA